MKTKEAQKAKETGSMLSEVQGQSEGVQVLRRVVEGRIRTPLLLVGPEGVGRRFSVVEAAREAFSKGDEKSPHSKRISQGIHPDLVVFRPPDGKDFGVDAMREVAQLAESYPSTVPVRYVVIDSADSMTIPAANALLKTLEEQPPTTRFFLLVGSPEAVLPTIRSRCGVVRYKPLPEDFVVKYVSALTDNPAKALVCTRLGEGSVGLAYQFLASGRLTLRNKVVRMLEACVEKDFSSAFSLVDEVEGDLDYGLRFLDHVLTDIAMLPHAPDKISNVDIPEKILSLKDRMGSKTSELVLGFRGLQGKMRSNALLPFHLKTLFASTFSR